MKYDKVKHRNKTANKTRRAYMIGKIQKSWTNTENILDKTYEQDKNRLFKSTSHEKMTPKYIHYP